MFGISVMYAFDSIVIHALTMWSPCANFVFKAHFLSFFCNPEVVKRAIKITCTPPRTKFVSPILSFICQLSSTKFNNLNQFFSYLFIPFLDRYLVEQEGCRALFKGLGANLVGVAPTRALYFCTYSTAKRKFNQFMTPDSHLVHMCSAGSAGKQIFWLLFGRTPFTCRFVRVVEKHVVAFWWLEFDPLPRVICIQFQYSISNFFKRRADGYCYFAEETRTFSGM